MEATHDVNVRQDLAQRVVHPKIQVNGRGLDEVIADAWSALLMDDRQPAVFLHDGKLVRIRDGQWGPEIIPMTSVSFYGELSRAADWVKATPRGLVDVFPSKDAARVMRAVPDGRVPLLDDVVCAPVFGSAGQVLWAAGYHASDRLWHHVVAEVPAPPAHPSPEDVAKARRLIEHELLGDFPLGHPSDRANALAALLLPFARRLVGGPVPEHLVGATLTGAGKSLFVDLVSILATGSLIFGGQVALRVPEVRELNAWRARKPKAVLAGSVRICLDPKSDRPWLRTGFRHEDLREWTLAHRGQLIGAGQVLVQNWLDLGRPLGEARLQGFERWSNVIGGILAAAGIEGFLQTSDARRVRR
ncbi:MAG: hypothetical protein ACYCWW_00260 [Deltaproteobacteria bacterium]